jgi:hypothetical protein
LLSCGFAHDYDLSLQIHTKLLQNGLVGSLHKSENVGGAGVINIDDEVCVFVRDFGTPNPVAFQTRRLDEPAGVIAGRIGEDAAQAANSIGLGCLALSLDRIGSLPGLLLVVGPDGEVGPGDHVIGERTGLERRRPVCEFAV